ncbi:MAG TPA: hypothetical protein DDW52_17415, partial [Planctomycetaceae bacterium]|nr:hypothetical protein [Planctomycetaceae bacterium]
MMLRLLFLLSFVCLGTPFAYGQLGPVVNPTQAAALQSAAQQAAVSGEPFGVFSLDVPLPAGGQATDAAGNGLNILVGDSAGRVYFPTYEVITSRQLVPAQAGNRPGLGLGIGRPGGLVDRIRNAVQPESTVEDVPTAIRIHGLFTGSQNLDVQVEGDVSYKTSLAVTDPQQSPLGTAPHRDALARWWSAYVSHARSEFQRGDFPSLFHRYMLSMLSHRLNVPFAELAPAGEDKEESESITLKTLSLVAGIDARRESILEKLLSPNAPADLASQPLPPPPAWSEDLRLQAKRPVGALPEIEPIATRVPPECLYLRFGSFRNYVWFQEMGERFGGDLAQAIKMRGFNAEATARMEKMLATKLTTVAKMFGDQLVQDMALIGTDLYVKEGASLGVILHATNPALLITTTQSERKRAAAETPNAQLQTVQIGGRDVSLLSTPDNRIRSFFVADGNFLLVTTSEHIVARFLQVAGGDESLAGTPEFQWTRQWMPAAQDYSVFAYFSPRFLQELVSPKHQIELSRRLEALGRIEIATVASQAAKAEGLPSQSLLQLQAEGFLPEDFLESADGSRPILTRDGQWIDSIRGARGSFLPIADTQIAQVTASEASEYEETANFFSEQWQQMDPMVFGLRRFRGPEADHETVAVEGYIAPFDADKYGWIGKQLGAPTMTRFRQPESDLVSAQVHMRAGAGLASSDSDYYLLGGLKDARLPELDKVDGLLNKFTAFASVPIYIGAWPKPDLVESLPLGIGRNFS